MHTTLSSWVGRCCSPHPQLRTLQESLARLWQKELVAHCTLTHKASMLESPCHVLLCFIGQSKAHGCDQSERNKKFNPEGEQRHSLLALMATRTCLGKQPCFFKSFYSFLKRVCLHVCLEEGMELEIVVSRHVEPGDQTQVLSKSSHCFYPLSHDSNPSFILLLTHMCLFDVCTMCMCSYVCMCVTVHMEVRGTSWGSFCYSPLYTSGQLPATPLCVPPFYCTSVGVARGHSHGWLYRDSGDLNSDVRTCAASALPAQAFPQW